MWTPRFADLSGVAASPASRLNSPRRVMVSTFRLLDAHGLPAPHFSAGGRLQSRCLGLRHQCVCKCGGHCTVESAAGTTFRLAGGSFVVYHRFARLCPSFDFVVRRSHSCRVTVRRMWSVRRQRRRRFGFGGTSAMRHSAPGKGHATRGFCTATLGTGGTCCREAARTSRHLCSEAARTSTHSRGTLCWSPWAATCHPHCCQAVRLASFASVELALFWRRKFPGHTL